MIVNEMIPADRNGNGTRDAAWKLVFRLQPLLERTLGKNPPVQLGVARVRGRWMVSVSGDLPAHVVNKLKKMGR